jgi:hypothetical protein
MATAIFLVIPFIPVSLETGVLKIREGEPKLSNNALKVRLPIPETDFKAIQYFKSSRFIVIKAQTKLEIPVILKCDYKKLKESYILFVMHVKQFDKVSVVGYPVRKKF